YVSLAKRYVSGHVAIDCVAGPSEVVVVADESAQPEFVAADLIAQAEHSPGVSILVTWEEDLLDEVSTALNRQLGKLARGAMARFTSGLTANDFLRCSSVMSFTLRGMKHLAEDVVRLAEKEGLTGHAASVSMRVGTNGKPLTSRPPKKATKSHA